MLSLGEPAKLDFETGADETPESADFESAASTPPSNQSSHPLARAKILVIAA
jgi:hypothetical protein